MSYYVTVDSSHIATTDTAEDALRAILNHFHYEIDAFIHVDETPLVRRIAVFYEAKRYNVSILYSAEEMRKYRVEWRWKDSSVTVTDVVLGTNEDQAKGRVLEMIIHDYPTLTDDVVFEGVRLD